MSLNVTPTSRPGYPADARPVPLRALAEVHPHPAAKGGAAAPAQGAPADQPVHPDPRQDHRSVDSLLGTGWLWLETKELENVFGLKMLTGY